MRHPSQMLTALITGASQGLGKEIARLLRERGFSVLTPNRKELDIGVNGSITAFCHKCPDIDVLINNAADLSESLGGCIRVNAMGAYLLTTCLWAGLSRTKGHVINISSREGLMGDAVFGRRPYSVSKATLNAITRMMADNANGVTVNACCPGWFRSRLGGDKAPISATEAADTPVWLATEAVATLNGHFFINRQIVPW